MLNKIRWYINQLLCPNCELQEGVVEEMNSRVSPDKRIRSINVTWDFNKPYLFNFSPELKMVDADATPSLFLAGRMVEGYGGKSYLKSLLRGYFERKGDIRRTYFDEHFGL